MRAYHLSTRAHQSIQFNSITMPKAQILERESAVTHDAHHSSAAAQESVARYPHDPLEASEIIATLGTNALRGSIFPRESSGSVSSGSMSSTTGNPTFGTSSESVGQTDSSSQTPLTTSTSTASATTSSESNTSQHRTSISQNHDAADHGGHGTEAELDSFVAELLGGIIFVIILIVIVVLCRRRRRRRRAQLPLRSLSASTQPWTAPSRPKPGRAHLGNMHGTSTHSTTPLFASHGWRESNDPMADLRALIDSERLHASSFRTQYSGRGPPSASEERFVRCEEWCESGSTDDESVVGKAM
ncbi:hypothetical protein C8Q72DRAFT_53308 [Fomitopsis betulina]|nr:hypothetical protein C8Q72DRAFT_53308 [Fomitopsis betulina]